MNKFDNNSPFRNVIFRNDSKKGIRKGVEITTECVCMCVCVRGIKRDREDDEFKFSLSRSSKLSSVE